ncbi:hypothetical protein SE92_16535 [Bradyrhizobium sp. AT1]|nr:hypothetical protein SE92_16535 [Bradyrhizobium sp. AT1]
MQVGIYHGIIAPVSHPSESDLMRSVTGLIENRCGSLFGPNAVFEVTKVVMLQPRLEQGVALDNRLSVLSTEPVINDELRYAQAIGLFR